jgi:hypothetical protein
MTNIWADTYKQIRDPFFKIEDPYTVSEEKKEKEEPGEKKHKEGPKEEKGEKEDKNEDKPKRWWDDDGDGKGYEKGEVSGKFPKKKVKEEVEQIDEISLKTKMKAYAASRDVDADYAYGDKVHSQGDRIKKAIVKKHGAKAGEHAERHAEVSNFGRGTPRAKPRIEKNRTYRTTKAGKMHGQDQAALKRDLIKRRNEEFELWVDSLVKEGYDLSEYTWNDMYEIYSEERELASRSKKTDKIDVRKGIKNEVNTKPTVSEESEAWIGELLEEGYDLSKFTLDEVIHIYESVDAEQLDEVNSSTLPPRGDAETVTKDPLQAAKAKAARAKVSKEIADLQVAKKAQMTKVDTNESVISYVRNHIDNTESLSEAVFNPKKSKMRPASERTQRVMTDAQRKAAKKEDDRVAQIHSKGATVLQGLMPQGKSGKVKTTPDPKPAAPEANRKVKGKEDTLASKADKILKSLKNK